MIQAITLRTTNKYISAFKSFEWSYNPGQNSGENCKRTFHSYTRISNEQNYNFSAQPLPQKSMSNCNLILSVAQRATLPRWCVGSVNPLTSWAVMSKIPSLPKIVDCSPLEIFQIGGWKRNRNFQMELCAPFTSLFSNSSDHCLSLSLSKKLRELFKMWPPIAGNSLPLEATQTKPLKRFKYLIKEIF